MQLDGVDLWHNGKHPLTGHPWQNTIVLQMHLGPVRCGGFMTLWDKPNTGVIGSNVLGLDCPSSNAITWVITVME